MLARADIEQEVGECRQWAGGRLGCVGELNLHRKFSRVILSETFGEFLSLRQSLVKFLGLNIGVKICVRGQTLHSFFDL